MTQPKYVAAMHNRAVSQDAQRLAGSACGLGYRLTPTLGLMLNHSAAPDTSPSFDTGPVSQ